MAWELITTYKEVIQTVRAFGVGVEEDEGLNSLLAFFRGWYYIPELDAVGPSKFIGYEGMTSQDYKRGVGLDGRDTEPVLSQWFEELEEHTPEYEYVSGLVKRLLVQYGRRPNLRARYNVPKGWGLTENKTQLPGEHKSIQQEQLSPIVDVFWRAYLGLYPEDQEALAVRIKKHLGT